MWNGWRNGDKGAWMLAFALVATVGIGVVVEIRNLRKQAKLEELVKQIEEKNVAAH